MTPAIIVLRFTTSFEEFEIPQWFTHLFSSASHIPSIGAKIGVPFCGETVILEVRDHRYTADEHDPKTLKLEVKLGLPIQSSYNETLAQINRFKLKAKA